MSLLQNIHLYQFKNHAQSRFQFGHRITAMTGLNGAGKTNLLDAIHYLCFARSYFTRTDAALCTHGQAGFRIQGDFEKNGQLHQVACVLREDGTKELTCNDEQFKRLSGFIGRFSCVMVCPDDIALVNETSDIRRKFLDTLLCQVNAPYLRQLQQYNKVLQQRNSALKRFAETGTADHELLTIYNSQLVEYGQPLYAARKQMCERLFERAAAYYEKLAGKLDPVGFEYQSPLHEMAFGQLLNHHLQRDLALQRTSSGPHRDDLVFLLHGGPFKQTASQGQKKTLLLALKLAELEILTSELDSPPLLLLDDIFEKLDAQRLEKLVHFIAHEWTGGVFLTDTNRLRVQQVLEAAGLKASIINIE